jgi:crotonobetainyl-CoA:carnitine CoA-transferase CaiB-like acyl-CoA transferase
MFDATVSWLTARAAYSFGNDEPFPRLGVQHPSAAPFGVFEAADESLAIAASTDSLWEKLCTAIDREDLLTDTPFADRNDRVTNADPLREELEGALTTQPVDTWTDILHDAGVPAGPIHDTLSVWEDDHVKQRDIKVTIDRDDRQDASVIDHPVHFADLQTALKTPPQELGESTDDVLQAHGYSPSELGRLRENVVIEQAYWGREPSRLLDGFETDKRLDTFNCGLLC